MGSSSIKACWGLLAWLDLPSFAASTLINSIALVSQSKKTIKLSLTTTEAIIVLLTFSWGSEASWLKTSKSAFKDVKVH